ncbi:YkuS family protein [Maledivibacter halophilus]|uniref:Uncharacterized protein family (UPF0180) n=1 Tax=Maledivibacter halophilus TaxID=36842 RepID=A0A1T5MPL6_9FIRM|nr:YkuS family protein [Maledivibacter halophilus]SKC90161.1 Uncharacterised protein family (UPF0180) [Maledivibacter halophilus]
MRKRIGIQKELNEIAEALTVNGFEVTNMMDTEKKLDAIIYYNEESDFLNGNQVVNENNLINNNKVLKINVAKTNINEIIRTLKKL